MCNIQFQVWLFKNSPFYERGQHLVQCFLQPPALEVFVRRKGLEATIKLSFKVLGKCSQWCVEINFQTYCFHAKSQTASSGGWNIRSVCLDSGLKMVGECWDLADGGWLQVALPGIKFSTSTIDVQRSLESLPKQIRKNTWSQTSQIAWVHLQAKAWHTSSPGSNNFVKQFANASALGHLEKFCPSHQNHQKHWQSLTFGRSRLVTFQSCHRLVTVSLMDAISSINIKSESASSVRWDCLAAYGHA